MKDMGIKRDEVRLTICSIRKKGKTNLRRRCRSASTKERAWTGSNGYLGGTSGEAVPETNKKPGSIERS